MSVSNVIGSAEVEDGMLLEQSAVPCHEENKGMAASHLAGGGRGEMSVVYWYFYCHGGCNSYLLRCIPDMFCQ